MLVAANHLMDLTHEELQNILMPKLPVEQKIQVSIDSKNRISITTCQTHHSQPSILYLKLKLGFIPFSYFIENS